MCRTVRYTPEQGAIEIVTLETLGALTMRKPVKSIGRVQGIPQIVETRHVKAVRQRRL
jgi:hypothetical protein